MELGLPVLGICYGMQLLAHNLGGRITASEDREYGRAELTINSYDSCPLWAGLKEQAMHSVWMSHGDHVEEPPPGFDVIASTPSVAVAAMADPAKKIYCLQFHPEVAHTDDGSLILSNFLFKVAGLSPDWTMSSFVETNGARGGASAAQGHRQAPDLHLRGQRPVAHERG